MYADEFLGAMASRENVELAFSKVLKHKKPRTKMQFLKHREKLITQAMQTIATKNWQPKYCEPMEIREKGKTRIIHKCSYLDKLIQQAIINIAQPYFLRPLIKNTFQSIPNRGLHKMVRKVWRAINVFKKNYGKVYFLQLDVAKFYPSVNHDELISILYKKMPSVDIVTLIKQLLESTPKNTTGLVLGNSLSQWLGNLYLYEFDHKISEFGAKYFRYADDIIIIHNDKELLKRIQKQASQRLAKLKLSLRKSQLHQITDTNAIDTIGYKFYINRIAIRRRIKLALKRAYLKNRYQSYQSLKGHTLHAHCKKMRANVSTLPSHLVA